MRVRLVGFVILLLLISFSSSMVIADTIDLNAFYADLTVSVAGDGASATMSEDPPYSPVLLSDDPYLGDPTLLPSDPFVLSFSYEFTVAAGNWDDFYVKLFDAYTGDSIEELLVENDNSGSVTDWTESGTVIWSIVDAPSTDLGFGLEFQLNSPDEVSGSYVQISDVEFNLNPVPEPATIFIFGLGLVGLAYTGRKNMFDLN